METQFEGIMDSDKHLKVKAGFSTVLAFHENWTPQNFRAIQYTCASYTVRTDKK